MLGTKLRSAWPKHHHILDDRVAFVAGGEHSLTSEVSKAVGIGRQLGGFVVQVDYYAGHVSSDLVEWIAKHQ